MPLYEFQCTNCGCVFETSRPFDDSSPVDCPRCGSESRRVFTPVALSRGSDSFLSVDRPNLNRVRFKDLSDARAGVARSEPHAASSKNSIGVGS
jgi:putative FmdB family regulatory protein